MIELRNHISDDHKRACRTLGYALHAGDLDIWLEATPVWRARLTPGERAAAAYSLLSALEVGQQQMIFEAILGSACMPLPPLMNHMEEANNWAFFSDPEQRKATALACFNSMHPSDQTAFIDHVTTRRAA